MNKCDNCSAELDRHIYCSDKCRMQFVRKANNVVRKANAEAIVIPRNETLSLNEPKRTTRALEMCKKHKVWTLSCGCR